MSHSDDVDDAIAFMQSMGTAGAAAAKQAPPPPPAPPQEPVERPAPPAAPGKPRAPAAGPQRPRTPRPKAVQKAKTPADTGSDVPSNNKIRFPVEMDPDLIALMALARPALRKKVAQIYMAAARRHAAHAAELPDTPRIQTVLDDRYDDVVVEAVRRQTYSGYVTRKGYEALDEDAAAAGLDHSAFMRRIVRRYIAAEHAFIPAHKAPLLACPSESCDAIMEELKAQMDSGRPAVVLPPVGDHMVWDAVELAEGTPLRALTDEAILTMPGCTSATQALLTVL